MKTLITALSLTLLTTTAAYASTSGSHDRIGHFEPRGAASMPFDGDVLARDQAPTVPSAATERLVDVAEPAPRDAV